MCRRRHSSDGGQPLGAVATTPQPLRGRLPRLVTTEVSRRGPLWVAGKYDDFSFRKENLPPFPCARKNSRLVTPERQPPDFSLRSENLPTRHCAMTTDDFSFRKENCPFSFHEVAAPLEPLQRTSTVEVRCNRLDRLFQIWSNLAATLRQRRPAAEGRGSLPRAGGAWRRG